MAVAVLASASMVAHAQTVAVSRGDAAAEEAERRFFIGRPGVGDGSIADEISDVVHDHLLECTRCSGLGDPTIFDSNLYSDCDALLLESIFNPNFKYGTSFQHPIRWRICGEPRRPHRHTDTQTHRHARATTLGPAWSLHCIIIFLTVRANHVE